MPSKKNSVTQYLVKMLEDRGRLVAKQFGEFRPWSFLSFDFLNSGRPGHYASIHRQYSRGGPMLSSLDIMPLNDKMERYGRKRPDQVYGAFGVLNYECPDIVCWGLLGRQRFASDGCWVEIKVKVECHVGSIGSVHHDDARFAFATETTLRDLCAKYPGRIHGIWETLGSQAKSWVEHAQVRLQSANQFAALLGHQDAALRARIYS